MIALHSELRDGILHARAQSAEAGEYAFYLYRGDERVHVQAYSADNELRWDTRLQPGDYRAKVFVRTGAGKPLSRYTAVHTVASPAVSLRRAGDELAVGARHLPPRDGALLRLYRNGALLAELPAPPPDGGLRHPLPGPDPAGIYHCEYGCPGEPPIARSRSVIAMPAAATPLAALDAWQADAGPLRLDAGRFVFPALFQPGRAGRLYVLLTGAVDRRRITLPKFARWSWAPRYPGHVLAVDDPTLELDPALELGWFMGTARDDATQALARAVQALARRLGVEPAGVVFYGSSGGGFAALAAAARLPGSTAVAINPQVDASRFFARQRDDLLRIAFGGMPAAQASQDMPERFCMQHVWRDAAGCRAIVVQNRLDRHHYQEHFPLLAQALGLPSSTGYSRDHRHFAFVYDDPAGHGPEPAHMVDAIIALSERFSATGAGRERPVLRHEDFQAFEGGGSRLPADGFQPRPDVSPVPLAPPVDWSMDPFADRNWRFHLQAWRFLSPIWRACLKTGDWSRVRRDILPYVLDWHRYHVARRQASSFAWYDMAVGLRAQHLALLLWLQQQGRVALSADEAAAVLQLAQRHADKLNEPGFISAGNHGVFQLHGLRLLELALAGQPGAKPPPAQAEPQLRAMLQTQFDRHGIHTENSPSYHLFIMRTFRKLRLALYPSLAEPHATLLSLAAEAAPWFTLPDGGIAPIGDSSGPGVPFPAGAHFAQTAQARDGSPVVWRDMSASGYAVVRTAPDVPAQRAGMLIVHGTGIAASHGHADQLGFCLTARGRRLFVDAGKYAYSTDAWRAYFVSDAAHNVVGLDGHAFGPADTQRKGSALGPLHAAPDGSFSIDGEIARGKAFVHRRRFLYRPGLSLTLIDSVRKPDASCAVSRLLLDPELRAEAGPQGQALIYAGDTPVARVRSSVARASLEIVRGQESPPLGWVSPSYLRRVPATALAWTFPREVTEFSLDIVLLPEPEETER